ncbi:unnamed protein product [Symbiodinium sp. CCMP2592]|nr:unnamed protein product [Symbiodinium sp. CCMP2592]
MRKRVDVSSKTMFFEKNWTQDSLRLLQASFSDPILALEKLRGGASPPGTSDVASSAAACAFGVCRSKMEDANGDHRAVSMEMTRDKLEADSARSIGKLRTALQSAQSDRPTSPREDAKEKSSKDLKLEEKQEAERLKQEQLERERRLFKTAEAGGEVSIEDLFLYFLRAIQRSEKVVIPPCVRMNLILTLIAIFIPSFLRLRNGGWFLGPGAPRVLFTAEALNVSALNPKPKGRKREAGEANIWTSQTLKPHGLLEDALPASMDVKI